MESNYIFHAHIADSESFFLFGDDVADWGTHQMTWHLPEAATVDF